MNPNPLNTTAIVPQRTSLGKANTAWDTALTTAGSNENHALGNHREVPIAYTAALKSNAQALGSYRHDIAYTGALKSAQVSQGVHASNGTQFNHELTGVEIAILAPVLFGGRWHAA